MHILMMNYAMIQRNKSFGGVDVSILKHSMGLW